MAAAMPFSLQFKTLKGQIYPVQLPSDQATVRSSYSLFPSMRIAYDPPTPPIHPHPTTPNTR